MIFNQLTNQEYNICIENISINESENTALVSPISWQKSSPFQKSWKRLQPRQI